MSLTREQALQAIISAERGDLRSLGDVLRSLVDQDTIAQTIHMPLQCGTGLQGVNFVMPAGDVTKLHVINNSTGTVFSAAEVITFYNVSRSANLAVLSIGSGLGTQGHVFSAAVTAQPTFTANSILRAYTDGASGTAKNTTLVVHMDRSPPARD